MVKIKLKIIKTVLCSTLSMGVVFVPMYLWNSNLQQQIKAKDKQLSYIIDKNIAKEQQERDYDVFKEQIETNNSFVKSIESDIRLETTTVSVSKPINVVKNSTDSTGIVGWWQGRKENNITIEIEYVCNYKIKYSDLQTKNDERGNLLVHYNPQTDFEVSVSLLSAIVLPPDASNQGFMPESFSPEEVIVLLLGNETVLKNEMLNNHDFIEQSTSTFESFFIDFAKKNGVNVEFVDYSLQ